MIELMALACRPITAAAAPSLVKRTRIFRRPQKACLRTLCRRLYLAPAAQLPARLFGIFLSPPAAQPTALEDEMSREGESGLVKHATAAVILALVVGSASTSHAAIKVTACGGTVPANQRAVLQNDITCEWRCSGDPSVVCGYNGECADGTGECVPDEFVLEQGATLNLNGHTITSAYQASAARCGATDTELGRCTVKGPGAIVGEKGTAISSKKMDLVVKDLTIGYSDYAISTNGYLTASGLVTLSDRENWISAAKGMTLKNAHLQSDAYSQGDVKVVNIVIGPNGGGVASASSIRGHDVLLRVQGGIVARDITLKRVFVVPDPSGYLSAGLSAQNDLRLVDSYVTTIVSGTEPVLVRSTCKNSEVYGSPSATWGVCSDD